MRVEILGQVKTLVSDHRHNKSVLQHLHKMEIDDLQDQLTFPNRSNFHNYLQAVIEIILAITTLLTFPNRSNFHNYLQAVH